MTPVFGSAGLAARALARCLDELSAVVEQTADVDYVTRPPGGVSGSVGAHVRHCLDHVHAVLDASAAGVMSYDHRARQMALEQCRDVAVAALRAASVRLERLATRTPDTALTLESRLDRDGGAIQVGSTLARELVFVLQHTIHHQALVAVLLAGRGRAVPHTFVFAPSTPRPAA